MSGELEVAVHDSASRNGGGITSIIHTLRKHWECRHLPSVSPAQNLSAGESSESQPLQSHWIAAPSSDPQSPFCWTAPVHTDIVNISLGRVSYSLT